MMIQVKPFITKLEGNHLDKTYKAAANSSSSTKPRETNVQL